MRIISETVVSISVTLDAAEHFDHQASPSLRQPSTRARVWHITADYNATPGEAGQFNAVMHGAKYRKDGTLAQVGKVLFVKTSLADLIEAVPPHVGAGILQAFSLQGHDIGLDLPESRDRSKWEDETPFIVRGNELVMDARPIDGVHFASCDSTRGQACDCRRRGGVA